ncbi:hypothetical protein HanPI659440_Chr01g0023091 [Helianthus annuus]|nr:hypothetical protein HanPI659440_Chr01g0023091 [Helianthus annuus]
MLKIGPEYILLKSQVLNVGTCNNLSGRIPANSSKPPTPLHEFPTFLTKTIVLPDRIPIKDCAPTCLPIRGGISPVNLLLFKSNQTRVLQFPSSVGMLPLRLLFASCNTASLDNKPNSGGISPEIELLVREIHSRLLQFNNSTGILPVR